MEAIAPLAVPELTIAVRAREEEMPAIRRERDSLDEAGTLADETTWPSARRIPGSRTSVMSSHQNALAVRRDCHAHDKGRARSQPAYSAPGRDIPDAGAGSLDGNQHARVGREGEPFRAHRAESPHEFSSLHAPEADGLA